MSIPNRQNYLALIVSALAITLAGCGGGSKILKEPIEVELKQPLASATDETLEASLDWVIVKDGPGTWSKNAWWDEYQFRIANSSDQAITISSIQVIDSLGTSLANGTNRKQLVKASKLTKKRYKEYDIKVAPGAGTGTLVAAGTGAFVVAGAAAMVSVGAGISSALSFGATTASTSGAVSAVGTVGVIAAPVLIVGGIVKSANNSKVNKEIISRQAELPIELGPGEVQTVKLFFPVAPSPRSVQLIYETAGVASVVEIGTADALYGLHLGNPVTDDAMAEDVMVAEADGDE